MTDQTRPSRSSRRSQARSLLALGLITATAGMLIWAKLRLVSGLPRSAYAEPRERLPGETPATDAAALPNLDGVDRQGESSDGHEAAPIR